MNRSPATYVISALRFIRRHWKKFLLGAVIGFPLLGILSFALSPAQPEYVTEPATRGDVRQIVEAVGTVMSERDLSLQFPMSGVVSDVRVKEGQKVKAGQVLASIRNGTQRASVASAAAIYQSEIARLSLLQQGSRPEDIAIAEADLQNKKASLNSAKETLATSEEQVKNSEVKLRALRAEADISLQGNVTAAQNAASTQLSASSLSLGVIDGVLADPAVSDAALREGGGRMNEIQTLARNAKIALQQEQKGANAITDYEGALTSLASARQAVQMASQAVQMGYDFIAAMPISGYYTSSVREAHKATLAAERSSLQSSFSAIDVALSTLRDGAAGYITRVASEEGTLQNAEGTRDRARSDIASYEASVRVAEAQLDLKRAGNRKEDIDAQAARVRQVGADVARAQASLSDTILLAPVDGTVTSVAVKVGEFTPAGAAITLLGESPYRVEMFVSEIDIPNVRLSQTGSIILDAFPGTSFTLRVGEIDPASTDVDGVAKYRIKLDFVYPHDNLKIGMTGDAEILTDSRTDVVSIPSRAVLENEEEEMYVRILLEDGTVEERTVETGIEGSDGEIEVTGIDEGEIVIVLERE